MLLLLATDLLLLLAQDARLDVMIISDGGLIVINYLHSKPPAAPTGGWSLRLLGCGLLPR